MALDTSVKNIGYLVTATKKDKKEKVMDDMSFWHLLYIYIETPFDYIYPYKRNITNIIIMSPGNPIALNYVIFPFSQERFYINQMLFICLKPKHALEF